MLCTLDIFGQNHCIQTLHCLCIQTLCQPKAGEKREESNTYMYMYYVQQQSLQWCHVTHKWPRGTALVQDLICVVTAPLISGGRSVTDAINDPLNAVSIVKQGACSYIGGCQALGNVEWNSQYY